MPVSPAVHLFRELVDVHLSATAGTGQETISRPRWRMPIDSRMPMPTLTSLDRAGAGERHPDRVADALREQARRTRVADLIVPWNAGPASVTPRWQRVVALGRASSR